MWQVVIHGNYETMRFDYETYEGAMKGYARARKKAAFSSFFIDVVGGVK